MIYYIHKERVLNIRVRTYVDGDLDRINTETTVFYDC